MLINYYLVFPSDYAFEESLLGAVEGQAAAEQNEEDDPAAPHVHRLAVGLSFHHLWCHEVWGAHSPCNGSMWSAERSPCQGDGRRQKYAYYAVPNKCVHANGVLCKSFSLVVIFRLHQ